MRIVVGGADGALGRGVSARLVTLGHDVVGIGARRPESWPGSVEFVTATEYLADAVKGADALLHCGGIRGLGDTAAGVGRVVVLAGGVGATPDGAVVVGTALVL